MRIGIDLDNTICNTSEKVEEYLEKYAQEENLEPIDIMNDDSLRDSFWERYLKDIYRNVTIKENVSKVLNHFKEKGHELFIITARDNYSEIEEITKEWLDNHHLPIDHIFMCRYGEGKAETCKENQIVIMIDDDPYNIQYLEASNILYLLFDDRGKRDRKNNYVTNWLEIERFIEGDN